MNNSKDRLYMIKDDILNYLYDINANCDLKLEEVADDIYSMLDKIYLTDITAVLGAWFDGDFDNTVPNEVIDLLQKAYTLATKELEAKHNDY